MATVAATYWLGETIAALLRSRRDLLAASGGLNGVPANIDIVQTSVARLAGAAQLPAAGLGLFCYQMLRSDHRAIASRNPALPPRTELALELSYLLVSWSPKPEEELGNLAWAMLELSENPTIDGSVLRGGAAWEQGELIQLAPEELPLEEQFRLWDRMGHKFRLAQAYRARVLRIRRSIGEDGPPVVASRFALEDAPVILRDEQA